MHTTIELIDLAKRRLSLAHNLPLPMSDYRLGKLMDIRQGTVSNWRTGKTGIGTEFAQKFAQACDLPEAYVYACIEHERTKEPSVLKILEHIAEMARGKAAAIVPFAVAAILAASFFSDSPENQAVFADAGAPIIFIMRNLAVARNRARCSLRGAKI